MIKEIFSIAGKPGLFKLVSQGKNMLIVESLLNGRRGPAYARDKVMSLGDISIYTLSGDVPLAEVFEKVYAKTEGKKVDVKGFAGDKAIREYFAEILPDFDNDRVYTTDIKKLLSWYNILIDAGFEKFVDDTAKETAEDAPAAEAEQA